jgi:hypothetical protein
MCSYDIEYCLARIKGERAIHNFENHLLVIIVTAPFYMMLIADFKNDVLQNLRIIVPYPFDVY